MVLLFLLSCDRPLLKLLLIPVELQFNLLNLLIDPENSYLNIVESFLIFWNYFIEFLDFMLESSALSFCDLPKMIFCFSLLIFGVDEWFSVE
jgi:hypothetical protein